jgi:hypothetical protein
MASLNVVMQFSAGSEEEARKIVARLEEDYPGVPVIAQYQAAVDAKGTARAAAELSPPTPPPPAME